MFVKLIIFQVLMTNIRGEVKNDFIIDYFVYKNVHAVVIYSCNTFEENLSLIKNFSEKNVATVFGNYTKHLDINSLAKTYHKNLGIFIDFHCYDVEYRSLLFKTASNHRLFDELYHWLTLDIDLESALKTIDDKTFGLSTDFVVAIYSANKTDRYKLYDVYNTSKLHGGVLNVTFLGSYNKIDGLNVTLTQSKFNRRSNLRGIVLKTIFFKLAKKPKNVTLHDYVTNYVISDKDSNTKFGYHIVHLLSDLYNFTIEHIESQEWEPTDLIGPIVRPMINNSVDLTGTPITMNMQRTYFVKFVHQDYPFRTCFIFRNPQVSDIKFQEILRPFSNDIWFLIVLFLILLILILIVVLYHETKDTITALFTDSILIAFGGICQQGTTVKIQRLSTHIVILMSLLFGLLIYDFYSACIVSARLAEPSRKINDSLNELGKLNLKIKSEYMSFLDYFLRQPHWDAQIFYKKYWQAIPKSERYEELEVAMGHVKKGGYAFHSYPDVFYPYIKRNFDNREICELMEVHLVKPTFTPFAVSINSSFVEIAKVGLTKISEIGLKRRQVLRWSQIKPQCRNDIRSASSITILEFAPHLLLVTFGYFISILIWTIEIFINNRKISSIVG